MRQQLLKLRQPRQDKALAALVQLLSDNLSLPATAVLAYAKHYGGVSNPAAARMVAVIAETMELEVDGASVSIAFDHTLTDSEDAHRTLVAMLRAMPKADA